MLTLHRLKRKQFMRKRTFLICIATWIAATSTNAQLTIDECRRMVHENYPAIKQYRLVEQGRDFTMSNAVKGYLPQITVNGTAAAFTDPADLSMMGGMDNTLYNVGVTVNQTIYDGGAIASRRRTAQAQADADAKRLDVTMYDVESRAELLFFAVLTLDAQLAQTATLIEDLGIGKRTVEMMAKNGVANQSDVDAVSVEIAKAKQKHVALQSSRKAYADMLGAFIGKEIEESTVFVKPEVSTTTKIGYNFDARPEMRYYDAQGRLLDERRRSLDTRLRPQLSAFGAAMYHSKPISLMNNSLLAVGLSLNWNIGALYTRKNDLQTIETDRSRIETERETFRFNTRLQAMQSDGQIEGLRKQLELDDEIVSLRESIRSKAERKVELGTETVNEMLRDINATSEARQARNVHEIEMLKEMYNLKHIERK